MNQEIKCIVVGGDGDGDFIQAIGAYTDYEKAYGAALLYLDELAENCCDEKHAELMITTLGRLEGDTGWGMWLKNKDGKVEYFAYILDNEDQYKKKEGDD